jgi:pimeloyl-ACP methyl ester carboxylesterase
LGIDMNTNTHSPSDAGASERHQQAPRRRASDFADEAIAKASRVAVAMPAAGPCTVLPEVQEPASVTAESVHHAFSRPRRFPLTVGDAEVLQAATAGRVATGGSSVATWIWSASSVVSASARSPVPRQDRRRRPRVLMVHGWESRASHWAAWIQPLLAAGFDVVAFDSPAHGDSDGDTVDVKQVGQAALDVAAALGPVDAVVGHSMGSAAVLHALGQGLRVRGSVHLAGPSSLERVTRYFAWQAGLHKSAWPRFQHLVAERLGQPLASLELAQQRHGLRHPGLIWHDRQDAEVPFVESLALQQAWPDATLKEATGLGHRRILRDASLIEQSVAFLATLPTPR